LAGLEPGLLAALGRSAETAGVAAWGAWFSLHVEDSSNPEASRNPAIAARYAVVGDRVELAPRFTLEPGLGYVARFHADGLARLLGVPVGQVPISELLERFEIPRPPATPSTTVAAIYPSAGAVPENLLKFYLHFSAPMTRGRAYRHLRIVDAQGIEVELAFIELEQELWDPAGRRLTLLFDPGRLKAGLKPRREVGRALAGGFDFALEVDADWPDGEGNPLREGYRHAFRVTEADYQQPDPDAWSWTLPRAGTHDPLVLALGEPLDQALLQHSIWVTSGSGEAAGWVEGTIELAAEEREWRFVPHQPWQPTEHELRVDPLLEDLAGNSIARPFEVDLSAPSPGRSEVAGPWRRRFVPGQ
jgi:hypothetical protein